MSIKANRRSTPIRNNTPSILSFALLSMLAHRARISLSSSLSSSSSTTNNVLLVASSSSYHPLSHPPSRASSRFASFRTNAMAIRRAIIIPPFAMDGTNDAVGHRAARYSVSSSTSTRCRVPSPLPPRSMTMRLRGGGWNDDMNDDDDVATSSSSEDRPTSDITNDDRWRRAYVAVGSNLGDRYRNVADALSELVSDGTSVRVLRTSYLRTTAPMYVTDQPEFLNGAVEIETRLSPMALLRYMKDIESRLGRDVHSIHESTTRYGPRIIDLDILLYDDDDNVDDDDDGDGTTTTTRRSSLVMRTEVLEIPHPRICEREFVLSPMRDLETAPSSYTKTDGIDDGIIIRHPIHNVSMSRLLDSLMRKNRGSGMGGDGGENDNEKHGDGVMGAVRVLPLPRGRMLYFNRTLIMGILNVTPDSFSDGGMHSDTVENAAAHAIQMINDGADIIDVGGESTRPGASDVSETMEMERTLPVIRRIRELGIDVPISIDTRRSSVAKAAIIAGADVINDVSGGTHDPRMLGVVSSLGVPMIIMHMRGTPSTMVSCANYDEYNGGVVAGVAHELNRRVAEAEAAGVHRWLQVIDPGIGFAKDYDGNLSLLGNLDSLRGQCGDLPLLIGPSRKRFIGEITGEAGPLDRDYGTVAACLASIRFGYDNGKGNHGDAPCNILRVHNVKAVKQAILVYDAIKDARRR